MRNAGLLAFHLLLAGAAGAGAPRYSLVDFGPQTQGVALNAAGAAVYYHANTHAAFLYADGRSTALPSPPDGSFLPRAMNDRGEILGRSTQRLQDEAGRRVERFFRFAQGRLEEVTASGLPAGVRLGDVAGIDHDGVVAAMTNERPARLCFVREGRVTALLDVASAVGFHEFTVVQLARGNAAGTVVGSVSGSHWEGKPGYTALVSDVHRGFVATERGVTDLGDFLPSAASGAGRLIGVKLPPGPASEVVRAKLRPAWRDGEGVREFDFPPGFTGGRFAAISPSGRIVGEGATVTGGGFLWIGERRHVFLFEDGAWRDLNELVAPEAGKAREIFSAVAVNDRGQILCQAMGEGGFRAVLLTPIAPPAR